MYIYTEIRLRPSFTAIFAGIIMLLFCSPLQTTATAQPSIPQITEYVTDLTGTLSPQEKAALSRKLVRFSDTTSNQIVVLVIPSLEGKAIEEYAIETARQNKIGSKDRNNGILFLIAKNDKKMRIEVGPGLEGALPDALAGSILRNEVTPYFQKGLFFDGIVSGVEAIQKATAGEYHAVPEKHRTKKSGSGIGTIIFIIIALIFIFSRGRLGFLPFFFGGFGGGGFGGGGGGSDDSGFGGFSGGGGDFSGGGASGDW